MLRSDEDTNSEGHRFDDSDASEFTPSTSDDVELDRIDDNGGLLDAEEAGIASKGRRRKRRRKLYDGVHEDETNTPSASKREQSLADMTVLKTSAINVLLIASWYCFSLSISIVSKEISSRTTQSS